MLNNKSAKKDRLTHTTAKTKMPITIVYKSIRPVVRIIMNPDIIPKTMVTSCIVSSVTAPKNNAPRNNNTMAATIVIPTKVLPIREGSVCRVFIYSVYSIEV